MLSFLTSHSKHSGTFIKGFTRLAREAVTQNDNRTLDNKALAAFVVTGCLIIFTIWSIRLGHSFSASDFGISFGSIWGGGYGLGRFLDNDPTPFENKYEGGNAKP